MHCTYYPDTKSGTPGADTYKVKGNIHWVSARHAYAAPVRLYDRLFRVPQPGRRARLHRRSQPGLDDKHHRAARAGLAAAKPGERFQFERHGYFVRDLDGAAFNRTVTLRDSWSKT